MTIPMFKKRSILIAGLIIYIDWRSWRRLFEV